MEKEKPNTVVTGEAVTQWIRQADHETPILKLADQLGISFLDIGRIRKGQARVAGDNVNGFTLEVRS